VSNLPKDPRDDGFDEEELIRSEFESIVSALSLDQSLPTTFLDELDQVDRSDRFVAPNPPPQSPRTFFFSAKRAVQRWLKRGYHEDDGVAL